MAKRIPRKRRATCGGLYQGIWVGCPLSESLSCFSFSRSGMSLSSPCAAYPAKLKSSRGKHYLELRKEPGSFMARLRQLQRAVNHEQSNMVEYCSDSACYRKEITNFNVICLARTETTNNTQHIIQRKTPTTGGRCSKIIEPQPKGQ